MSRIRAVIAREIKEALPATIFFLFLFHMVALTKAVSLEEYDITALRATGATVGALIVAKAILLVEALPIATLFSHTLIFQLLWKTLLYGSVTLLFRLLEEFIPLALHHGGLNSAAGALYEEVSWPLFGVMALWIFGGLFLYCVVSGLTGAIGPARVKAILFGSADRPCGS